MVPQPNQPEKQQPGREQQNPQRNPQQQPGREQQPQRTGMEQEDEDFDTDQDKI